MTGRTNNSREKILSIISCSPALLFFKIVYTRMRTPFYLYLSLCVSVSLIHTPAPKALGLVEIFILELELQALSGRSFRCHRALRKQESLLSSLSTFQVSGWAVIKGGDWLCFILPGKGRTLHQLQMEGNKCLSAE